ncbi:hypothetical protein N8T08_008477 [Aspergillus melleus]|uniref:Uncharacterized protein n=1 Tax=Aspergillus melleus TaxID=138277 RepID=A0ACC3AVL4_9EURO|nr:hypothetical protein N8T08_008477 [Aspergillus melleus]
MSMTPQGRRVAVIGNGSSGIQIVPGILPKVAHLDHYIRSGTWIAPTFARDEVNKRGTELGNCFRGASKFLLPGGVDTFKQDHQVYQRFRKSVERELQSVHNATRLGTPEQIEVQDVCAKSMRKRLSQKPELFDQLLPSFPPFCRRITPGPGYLEALTVEKVDVITSNTVKVKKDGIVAADGAHHPTDVPACATGFDTTFTPRFPVLGRGGLSLSDRWEKTPETHLSPAVDEFPKYFICFGPNSALGGGNLLVVVEKLTEYITACAEKMQRDKIRTMTPRKEAVERFTSYCDQHFSRTTFGQGCSSLHAMTVLGHPRWEDYTYGYVNDDPNGWFGDGHTLNEKNKAIDVAYLDDDQIDFPPWLKA